MRSWEQSTRDITCTFQWTPVVGYPNAPRRPLCARSRPLVVSRHRQSPWQPRSLQTSQRKWGKPCSTSFSRFCWPSRMWRSTHATDQTLLSLALLHPSRKRRLRELMPTDHFAQVVDQGFLADGSASQADVAVRADQDQCITSNAIGAGSLPLAIDQGVVGVLSRILQARNGVDTQSVLVGSGQWESGLVTEDEQREMWAAE